MAGYSATFISGDGTYGNPDRGMLEMLEQARPTGEFTVHLTYAADLCDAVHQQWVIGRKNYSFTADVNSIGDIVTRWKAAGRITVKEGPVGIEF